MSRQTRWILGLAASLLLAPVQARPDTPPEARVESPADPSPETVRIVDWAREILQQVEALPPDKHALFAALVGDAAGFAIFPRITKSGLIVADISGQGVLIYREPDGQWSLPILLRVHGSSIGPQVGVQTSEVLVVFKTKAALDRLGELNRVATDSPFTHGAPGAAADIVSHQTNKGLLLGQSIDRMTLVLDPEGNASLYGREIKPGPIARSLRASLKPPPCIQKLLEQANALQGKPPVSRQW